MLVRSGRGTFEFSSTFETLRIFRVQVFENQGNCDLQKHKPENSAQFVFILEREQQAEIPVVTPVAQNVEFHLN